MFVGGVDLHSDERSGDAKDAFNELDAKIDKAMRDYAIPGVAVGVIADGDEYIKGTGSPMSTTRPRWTATPCSGSAPRRRRSPERP